MLASADSPTLRGIVVMTLVLDLLISAGSTALGAGNAGMVAAFGASGRPWAMSVIAHELPEPTRQGFQRAPSTVVLDQNPDGEIVLPFAAARTLALGGNGNGTTGPIEIGIFTRDNLR